MKHAQLANDDVVCPHCGTSIALAMSKRTKLGVVMAGPPRSAT